MRPKPIPPLYKHQVHDAKFCLDNPVVLDASDPGCGKTRVQIEAFAIRRKKGGGKALVLCPKSLLRSAWENDFMKFAPSISVSVAPADKRADAFAREADIYVTNLDAVVWLAKQPPKFFKGFDTLIIDEITAFKHHTSQRSRAVKKISKYFDRRYGLTGTPNSNTIADIWHQICILDGGKRLGTSFFAFRSSVCSPIQVGREANMVKWEDKEGAEMAVAGLLKDIVIRNVFEECHDIPPNITNTVPYFMSPKQAKVYQQMEKNAIALVNNKQIVSAVNAAVVSNKLLQISCIAEGTEVLTDSGWKPIEAVSAADKVWDGIEWASSFGGIYTGYKEVIDCDGVLMTPEHKVLTESGWVTAEEIQNGYDTTRFNRKSVRLPDSFAPGRSESEQKHTVVAPMPVWKAGSTNRVESRQPKSPPSEVLRMQPEGGVTESKWNSHDDVPPPIQSLGKNSFSLRISIRQGLAQLRRTRDQSMSTLGEVRKFLRGYVSNLFPRLTVRPNRQFPRIFKKELPLGDIYGKQQQHPSQCMGGDPSRENDYSECCENLSIESYNYTSPSGAGGYGLPTPREKKEVYDVGHVMPRHRFTVRGKTGKIFIVHNSGACYNDGMTDPSVDNAAYVNVDDGRYELVRTLVEERENPSVVFFNWVHQRDGLIKEFEKHGITYVLVDGSVTDNHRAAAVKHFQAGFYQVFLGHPASVAHGLTLTKATTTIWTSPTYNLEHYIQGNRRTYRAGQTKKTETIVILAEGTIEKLVFEKLSGKDQRQINMLAILKELT